jgi:hypothetical protein
LLTVILPTDSLAGSYLLYEGTAERKQIRAGMAGVR